MKRASVSAVSWISVVALFGCLPLWAAQPASADLSGQLGSYLGPVTSGNLLSRPDGVSINRPFPVIVRYRPGFEAARVAGVSGRAVRHLTLDHSDAIRLTPAEIERLAASGAIESIEPDTVCTVTRDTSQATFGVTKARSDFGLNGDGDGVPGHYTALDHTIAVIDTGIDGTHQDFAGGKIIGWQDFVNGRPLPYDDHGHGTHCASIAAGEVNAAGVGGAAPGAALVGLKVLAADGSGLSSTIAEAIEWCIANKETYGIRVISMSLASAGSSDGTDLLSRTVNRAVEAGIVVCVAAGNSGPESFTIGTPGAAAEAITVGNMVDAAKGGFALLESSSRGPTADGRVKPDLCAPGYAILAAQANTGNGYIRMTGTSMACPFVAGLAALMLQANPALTPAQVKATLKQTAVHFGPAGDNNEFGAGRVDGYAALAQASERTGTGPIVPDHVYHEGSLRGSGDAQAWDLPVSGTSYAIAATLMMEAPGESDRLELFDPAGNLVAVSFGADRQQTLIVAPQTTGTYRLVARSGSGSGSYALDVSAVMAPAPAPVVPISLAARLQTPVQIQLTWTGGSPSPSSLTIFRKTGNGRYLSIDMAKAGVSSFLDSNLASNTTYTYRLQLRAPGGPITWSNEISVTTPRISLPTVVGRAAASRRSRLQRRF